MKFHQGWFFSLWIQKTRQGGPHPRGSCPGKEKKALSAFSRTEFHPSLSPIPWMESARRNSCQERTRPSYLARLFVGLRLRPGGYAHSRRLVFKFSHSLLDYVKNKKGILSRICGVCNSSSRNSYKTGAWKGKYFLKSSGNVFTFHIFNHKSNNCTVHGKSFEKGCEKGNTFWEKKSFCFSHLK